MTVVAGTARDCRQAGAGGPCLWVAPAFEPLLCRTEAVFGFERQTNTEVDEGHNPSDVVKRPQAR